MIICPNCKEILYKKEHCWKCKNNHSFDVSKEGYINLLLPNMTSSNFSGDNKIMVNSRSIFLNKGFYKNLSEFLVSLINKLKNNLTILDCGCGEGYFTDQFERSTKYQNIIGLDISKIAISKAAKRNKNIIFIVGSSAHIPLLNNSVDIIMNIFAPHFDSEFARIIKEDGYLIKVIPNPMHLHELKEILYDDPYYVDTKVMDLNSFELVDNYILEYETNLSKEDIDNLFQMTPYFYTTSKEDKDKLSKINNLKITFSFKILLYKKTKPNQ